MDDLTTIKRMLWELNCKVEFLLHKDDFVERNGVLIPVSTREHDKALKQQYGKPAFWEHLPYVTTRREVDKAFNEFFRRDILGVYSRQGKWAQTKEEDDANKMGICPGSGPRHKRD